MKKVSHIEERFARQLGYLGIAYDREFLAIPERKFSFDFVIKNTNVLIEIQGGTWQVTRTGHSSGAGIKRDCIKSNLAQANGLILFKFTSDMVQSGEAIEFLANYLGIQECTNTLQMKN